jgi:hypothetical protein
MKKQSRSILSVVKATIQAKPSWQAQAALKNLQGRAHNFKARMHHGGSSKPAMRFFKAYSVHPSCEN